MHRLTGVDILVLTVIGRRDYGSILNESESEDMPAAEKNAKIEGKAWDWS